MLPDRLLISPPALASMVAACLAATSASAQGTPQTRVRLLYERGVGAEHCPDEASLRGAVAGRVGYDPFAPAARDLLRVSVSGPDVLRANVERTGPRGESLGRRTLESSAGDCQELSAALELAIAIAIDPLASAPPVSAPPEPPPPPPLSPPPLLASPLPAPIELSVGVLGGVSNATGRGTGAFGGLFQVKWPRFSLSLEGRFDLPTTEALFIGEYTVSLATGSLVPCARLGLFAACGVASLGAYLADSRGVNEARSVSVPFVGAGLRALVELPIGAHVRVRLQLEPLLPLTRLTLTVSAQPAWRTPAMLLSAGAGLAIAL